MICIYVFQVDAMNYYFNEVIENKIDTFLISSEKTELSAFYKSISV